MDFGNLRNSPNQKLPEEDEQQQGYRHRRRRASPTSGLGVKDMDERGSGTKRGLKRPQFSVSLLKYHDLYQIDRGSSHGTIHKVCRDLRT